MARLAVDPREIPQLAIEAASLSDTTALLTAARGIRRRAGHRPAMWIAMGKYGLPSRTAPAHFGSAWSYASDPGGPAAAPGHLSPEQLSSLYRVGQATGEWPLYAVLGSPVAHSLSPAFHNRRFQEENREADYIPVRGKDMPAFFAFAEAVDIRGVSVTVPHKVAALALATDASGKW